MTIPVRSRLAERPLDRLAESSEVVTVVLPVHEAVPRLAPSVTSTRRWLDWGDYCEPLNTKEKIMSVRVFLEVQVTPDDLDRAHNAVRNTLVDTRAFPGCLGVEVLIDESDPSRLLVFETWESFAAHDAYTHYRANDNPATELRSVVVAAPTTRRFTVGEDL